jgi:hypothetical protein
MATSGSVNFNQNRNEIIQDAFGHLNIYGSEDTIDSADLLFASNQLNKMVKAWQAQSIHLWKKQEVTLFLTLSQALYTFPSSTAFATADDYVTTAIGADEAIGQTTITLTDTTGINANDYVGITLDSGDFQWATVLTVPNSTTITINNALTDTAAENNIVYTFTNKITRPLRVLNTRRNNSADQDVPMFIYSYQDYFNLPNKTTTGTPVAAMYSPLLDVGNFYIWPTPVTTTDKIKFTAYTQIEDFDAATNTPDFPTEWLEVLAMQLAVRISYRYGRRKYINELKMDADDMLKNMLGWDNEDVSIQFQPAEY